jgi:hypothetical protein
MEWDEQNCRHLGPHRHTGELGCRVRISRSAPWNESAAKRWRDLHRQVYQRCRRERLRPRLLARVWEMQKRGLLHVHPVLGCSTPSEKRAAERYLHHLEELRERYGFGYVERKQRVREPRAAAAYLSSYFITGKGRKASLEQSVQSNWMPHSIIHVSQELTKRTQITMRTLRLKRFLWIRLGPGALDVMRLIGLSYRDGYAAWCMGLWGPDFISAFLPQPRAP